MSNTPNRGIPYVPQGTLDPAAGLNTALDVIDALLQTAVISMDQTAPPSSSVDGDLYIVAPIGATDEWAEKENHLARYRIEGNFWQFYTPGDQVALVVNSEDAGLYKWVEGSPGSWVLAAGLSDAPADGELYARRDSAWEVVNTLTIVGPDGSPAAIEVGVTLLRFFGADVEVSSPGVVDVTIPPGAADDLTYLTADDETASLPNSRRLVAGSGVTFDDTTPGEREISASGGGGGSSAGAPLVFGYQSFGADAGSWGGFTLVMAFKGTRALTSAAGFKCQFTCTVTGLIVSAMVARRTLKNSTTFIDSTAITIGGASTPTLTPGVIETDTIAVAVDKDHDYYVLIFFNASTPSTAKLKVGSDGGATALATDVSGNHTADATVPATPATGTAYGAPDFVVA